MLSRQKRKRKKFALNAEKKKKWMKTWQNLHKCWIWMMDKFLLYYSLYFWSYLKIFTTKMWLLAELSSLMSSVLRASVPCWPWAGGLHQFLTSLKDSWPLPEQARKHERTRRKPVFFINLTFKLIFHHFFSAHFERGSELYKSMNTRRWDHWGCLGGCLPKVLGKEWKLWTRVRLHWRVIQLGHLVRELLMSISSWADQIFQERFF